jgi:hypothetical protein
MAPPDAGPDRRHADDSPLGCAHLFRDREQFPASADTVSMTRQSQSPDLPLPQFRPILSAIWTWESLSSWAGQQV